MFGRKRRRIVVGLLYTIIGTLYLLETIRKKITREHWALISLIND